MRKFAVIGLGHFGFSVAKVLHEEGHEVLAIDSSKEVIQNIKDFCTQAILADARDKETLIALGVEDVDVAIVSLGEQMEASILVTLHLQEIGVKEIIAKALSEDHAKILRKIGASEVIFPEKDMAERLARRLSAPNMIDYLPLTPEYGIMEVAPPSKFVGKSLAELKLRNKYDIQVIAIKGLVPEKMTFIPSPDFVIKDSDSLVILGRSQDLERLKKIIED